MFSSPGNRLRTPDLTRHCSKILIKGQMPWAPFHQHVYKELFFRADPNSAKRQSSHHFLFALLGSARAKAPHKMLVKLTPSLVIVKIDSRTWSFCLRHCVQNGPSYLGEETRPTLCKTMPSFQLGFKSWEPNKHQLLHRITSMKTPLIYNIVVKADDSQLETFWVIGTNLKMDN